MQKNSNEKAVSAKPLDDSPTSQISKNQELALDMANLTETMVDLCKGDEFIVLSNIFKMAHAEALSIAEVSRPKLASNAHLEDDQWDDVEWRVAHWKDSD